MSSQVMPFQFSLFSGSSGTGSWHVSFGQVVDSIKREVQFRPASDTTADNGGFIFPLNHCKVHKTAAYPFPAVTFPCQSAVEPKTRPVIRDHEEVFVHGLTETWSVQLWWHHCGHFTCQDVKTITRVRVSASSENISTMNVFFKWHNRTLTSKNPSRFDHHLQLFIPCESPDIIFKYTRVLKTTKRKVQNGFWNNITFSYLWSPQLAHLWHHHDPPAKNNQWWGGWTGSGHHWGWQHAEWPCSGSEYKGDCHAPVSGDFHLGAPPHSSPFPDPSSRSCSSGIPSGQTPA